MNRQTEDGRIWKPNSSHGVCSEHFVDGAPTARHPDPELKLGYDHVPKKRQALPKARSAPAPRRSKQDCHAIPVATCSTESGFPDSETVGAPANSVDVSSISVDHSYCFDATAITTPSNTIEHSYCVETFCTGCVERDRIIADLRRKIMELESANVERSPLVSHVTEPATVEVYDDTTRSRATALRGKNQTFATSL